ncbi:MAG: FAD:protein FMN transferase, partial [Gemmatimonadota bacterium]
VLYAPDTATARAAARAAYTRIVSLEDVMSDYRPSSELRRLSLQSEEWVAVGPDLFAVLERALFIARATDGAYDPTLGPLTALWRDARSTGVVPPRTAIDAARARTGPDKIRLDRARRSVRLGQGVVLDLGGIAKGFILQQAMAVLQSHGIASALLEAGGDVVVGAAPPGRDGWRIEAPTASPEVAARAASLAHSAIATSGPSEQFLLSEGVRYSHVVDPRTGLGVTGSSHATVIAADAATADALATALTVLSPARAAIVLASYPDVLASVDSTTIRQPARTDRR